MRQVYSPPTSGGRWYNVVLSAMLITLAVFLVLPLTQMISSRMSKERYLQKVDTAVLDQPNDFEEPPPPPPEEKEEKPPEPKLDDAPQPMNLNLNLNLAVGSGGFLPGLGADDFAGAAAALDELPFDISELDNAPVLLSSVQPRYPSDLARAKVEGGVTILFLLNDKGRVEDPRVEKSSHRNFEKPALDAVKRWRFKPGMKEGKPVSTYMRLPITFRISA